MTFNGRHMLREYAGGSVGGILRKTQNSHNMNAMFSTGAAVNNNNNIASSSINEERQLDLLVFGYACKVFRDDDKAREIDQGRHLIPWMGDTNLKIDRYDVRGALYELAPYEPPPGGYGNRLEYLSADEQRAEQLCEEERYKFLYHNEEEHILQQDEEMKRLKQATNEYNYNQVGFQYGDESAPQIGPNPQDPDDAAAKQAFILPRNFDVPPHIQLPETMKQHAIIEKTARFIASQGMQMEILLKAKQSNNAQFEFLTQDSLLNPYYKFVLEAFKNGSYPEESTKELAESVNEKTTSNEVDVAQELPNKAIVVPTIKFTPSENCAYTQLISKIKGVPLEAVISEATKEATPEPAERNEKLTSGEHSSPQVEVLKNTSALALAQNYSSETESEEEEVKEEQVKLNFPVPVDNLKSIIEKTATYVIKIGRKFEETLRSRDTERFKFLLPENEYYAYYLYKVTGDPDAASKEEKTRRAAAVAAALLSRKGLNREKNVSPTPVSFTIKPKEEASVSGLPAALPQDDASDDESEHKKNSQELVPPQAPSIGPVNAQLVSRQVADHVQKAVQMIESQLLARNTTMTTTTTNTAAHFKDKRKLSSPPALTRQQINLNLEQEQRAQFEQQQQNRQKELKRVEEKVKDKLAQIAREKLCGLITKEKQLQQERKRKAIVFLNQIKNNSPEQTKSSHTPPTQLEQSDNEPAETNDIFPISFYGPPETEDVSQNSNDNSNFSQITKSTFAPAQVKEADNNVVTVLSDDDDVMVVSEIRPAQVKQKPRRSRSRSRSHSHKRKYNEKEVEKQRHRHKSSHSSSKKKKRRSKKHDRSRSRSGSRYRRSSSRSSSRGRSKSKSKKHKSRH